MKAASRKADERRRTWRAESEAGAPNAAGYTMTHDERNTMAQSTEQMTRRSRMNAMTRDLAELVEVHSPADGHLRFHGAVLEAACMALDAESINEMDGEIVRLMTQLVYARNERLGLR